MGLRGPGAKAIRRPLGVIGEDRRDLFGPVAVKPAAPAWDAPGLSRAERVVAFLESLEVTAGRLAGQPFRVRDWQRDILEAIYREDEEGKRPVRTAVLTFGRKNGKTGLAAGLALCHLAGPEAERRGEVYSAANDKEQAGKTFAEMVAMVEVHPILSGRINVKRFGKELEDLTTGSIFKALSADVAGKHGLSPSCVIYDESVADGHLDPGGYRHRPHEPAGRLRPPRQRRRGRRSLVLPRRILGPCRRRPLGRGNVAPRQSRPR
jgi:hypothetical protein